MAMHFIALKGAVICMENMLAGGGYCAHSSAPDISFSDFAWLSAYLQAKLAAGSRYLPDIGCRYFPDGTRQVYAMKLQRGTSAIRGKYQDGCSSPADIGQRMQQGGAGWFSGCEACAWSPDKIALPRCPVLAEKPGIAPWAARQGLVFERLAAWVAGALFRRRLGPGMAQAG